MGLSSMESLGPTWPEVQSVRILLFIEKEGLTYKDYRKSLKTAQ